MTEFDRPASERDLRMRELEQEVNALCLRYGEAARYPLASGLAPGDDATRSRQAMEMRNAVVKDVTERAQAVETLRRSENELRDFVENASIGLQWIGPDGTVLWANQTESERLGYTRDEYVGRQVSGSYVDQPVIEDIFARLKGGETLLDYAARLRHKDGSIRHVLINSNALVEDGKFIHTRCFTRDITDHTLARDALRESEAFNRSIIESSPDCIKILDLQGNLLSMFNGQQLLGIEDIRPFLNQSWLAFWKDGDRQAAQFAINAALAGGAGRFIGFFSTLSGEPKWWDVAITPINLVTPQGGGPARGDLQLEGGMLGLIRARTSVAGGVRDNRFVYTCNFRSAHLSTLTKRRSAW